MKGYISLSCAFSWLLHYGVSFLSTFVHDLVISLFLQMKAKEEIKMKMKNSYGVSFVSTFVRDLVISLIFYPKKKRVMSLI